MAKKIQQLHVASLEKAIGDLLCAHQNVVDTWYAGWEQRLRCRAEGLVAKRSQSQNEEPPRDFELT